MKHVSSSLAAMLQHLVCVHDVEVARGKCLAERVDVGRVERDIAQAAFCRTLTGAREGGTAIVVFHAKHSGRRVAPGEINGDGAWPASYIEDSKVGLGGRETVEVWQKVASGVCCSPLSVGA